MVNDTSFHNLHVIHLSSFIFKLTKTLLYNSPSLPLYMTRSCYTLVTSPQSYTYIYIYIPIYT